MSNIVTQMRKQEQAVTNSNLQQIRANKFSIYEYKMYFKEAPSRLQAQPESEDTPAHVHRQINLLDTSLDDLHLYLSTQQQFIFDELTVSSF